MRALTWLALTMVALTAAAPAQAQDRARAKEVIVAFAAFEIWFFFFSGSPIGAN